MHIVIPIFAPLFILSCFGKGDTTDKWLNLWKFDYRKSLIAQKLFWACLLIPCCLFLSFGYIAWQSYSIDLTSKGLEEFIKISKLPLALLSTAIPFGAIAASFHSTEQTGKQISNAKSAQAYEQQLQKYHESIAVINTINLIIIELGEAWDIYYREYALELIRVPEGEAYIATYALGDNLFPIFNSAPMLIANAPFDITSDIVRIHMRIKGLITTLNNNNRNSEIVRQSAIRQADDEIADLRRCGITSESVLQSRWVELYSFYSKKEAHNLAMNHETASLKALTALIQKFIAELIPKIKEYVRTNTPAAPALPND